MKLKKIVEFLDNYLDIDAVADMSLNGLQFGDMDAEIDSAVLAVDASLELFEKAGRGNKLLVVHHGLFWGSSFAITGIHYERFKKLFDNELSLYAAHLPLDLHAVIGHNARIAAELGLTDILPFGDYKGTKIGFKGMLAEPLKMKEFKDVLGGLFGDYQLLQFGKEEIRNIGVVSGGAASLIPDAIKEGLDLYITGEASHSMYHFVKEARLNVVFGGHYNTEKFGILKLGDLLEKEFGLKSEFIDIPTGF